MVTFNHVSKRRAVRYFDRVCDYQEYCVTGSKFGKRVVVRRWRDTGETELRAVRGDGRNRTSTTSCGFREYGQELLMNPTVEDLAVAVRALAAKHFG